MATNASTLDQIVSEFFTKTCSTKRRSHSSTLSTLSNCINRLKCRHFAKSKLKGDVYLFPAGSCVETCVLPLISDIDSLDVIVYYSSQLAVPPQFQLPSDLSNFHKHIDAYEFVSTRFPGYVLLSPIGHFVRSEDEDDYVFKKVAETDRLSLRDRINAYFTLGQELVDNCATCNATSVTNDSDSRELETAHHGCNITFCVHCPVWPKQAEGWSSRHRSHGWPDSGTIGKVTKKGCEIVRAFHPSVDGNAKSVVCQLSFPQAEVDLLQTWTSVQQTVYHMLRTFIKKEIITSSGPVDNVRKRSLSVYHIKCLMLWACELKGPEWWNGSSLVQICTKLLATLTIWLDKVDCRHYFVKDWNQFRDFESENNLSKVSSTIKTFTPDRLSIWFIENYIQPCVQLSPSNAALFEKNVRPLTGAQLSPVVDAVIKWREQQVIDTCFSSLTICTTTLCRHINRHLLSVQSLGHYQDMLKWFESCLSEFFVGIAYLHIASRLERARDNLTKDDLMDILPVLANFFSGKCLTFFPPMTSGSESSCLAYMKKGLRILRKHNIARQQPSGTDSLVELTLSKLYLHRAAALDRSLMLHPLIYAYLAALYYVTGEYQKSLIYCTHVEESPAPHHYHVVEGPLLPELDAEIDHVFGLAVLYQYVIRLLSEKWQILDMKETHRKFLTIFSIDLFTFYLHLKCLTKLGATSSDRTVSVSLSNCRRHLGESADVLITDALLFCFVTQMTQKSDAVTDSRPAILVHCTPQSKLDHLLTLSAVEHLTSYQDLVAQNYPTKCTGALHFQALYRYKCGSYTAALKLSRQMLNEMLRARNVGAVTICPAPPLLALMDDDIASMMGLVMLFRLSLRDFDNSLYNADIHEFTVAEYIAIQCLMKLKRTFLRELLQISQSFHSEPVICAEKSPFGASVLRFIYRKAVKYHQNMRSAV